MVNNKFLFDFSKLFVTTVICFAPFYQCINVSSSEPPQFENRIINGIRADNHQFPYQISLQMNYEHICGGSIISDVKVLTAGHCVTDRDGLLPTAKFRILAGSNNLDTTELNSYYSVRTFSIHPKFHRATTQYDYAVVFIKRKFDFRYKTISTIPLATEDPRPGTVCYVSGWGDVAKSEGKRPPNELQYATITVDPPEVCSKLFDEFFSSAYMLCAGMANIGNAGSGDSGGPFVCNSKLNGIVSFGRKYDNSKYPDVYSSVAFAYEWINTTNGSTKQTVGDGFYSVTTVAVIFITHYVMLLE